MKKLERELKLRMLLKATMLSIQLWLEFTKLLEDNQELEELDSQEDSQEPEELLAQLEEAQGQLSMKSIDINVNVF
jgi:hypothetical protein